MLRTYKYIETDHQKLHDNIMSFFDRIEFETGEFSFDFFGCDFYNQIAKHHPSILVKPLKLIYSEIKTWTQDERSHFIQRIKESNDIERICKREIIPLSIDDIPSSIRDRVDLKKLSKDLYIEVLQGHYTSSLYGNLQSHFELLKKNPNDFIKCPACGLMPAKSDKEHRDQYDHYLNKDKYIFSSVNFKNLVPVCSECNSILVKGEFDVLNDNAGRKIFYPYDETHQGISVLATIKDDTEKLSDLEFVFIFKTEDNRDDEIESWKSIYKIEKRYTERANAAACKWYKHFWNFCNSPKYSHLPDAEKKDIYIDCQDKEDLEVIKIPIIISLQNSSLSKAALEAKFYSMEF